MALDAILTILITIAEYTFVPIKRHLSYTFNYKSKVDNLKNHVQELKSQRDSLQQEVDAARSRGDAISDNVQQWLNKVSRAIERFDEEFNTGEEQAKAKCFYGFIPNLKMQHSLGANAVKKDPEYTKLQEDGRFDNISSRPALMPLASSAHDIVTLQPRALMLKNVMDALMDPAVNMVGVFGTSGIGKTTLAMEVCSKAMEANLFDDAVLTTVSETPNLKLIQGRIASMLCLELPEETVEGRASLLRQHLTSEKKILIILDYVWKELKLESIGIPLGDDHPRCKILVMSRNCDILSQKMGAQITFELELMSEPEALRLFEVTVGEVAYPIIAKDIAKKCSGLPLLIVTVASALKDRPLHEWRYALKKFSELDNKGFQEKLYLAMELIFRHLPSPEIKPFFLLCAQLAPNHIKLQSLVIYSLGLRLFRNTITVADGGNNVLKLIHALISVGLLVKDDRHGFFKMHDAIRDALLIASTTQRAFTCRDMIGLNQLPNKDLHGNFTSICLPGSEIHEFPERLECPEVELLVLGTGGIDDKDVYPIVPDSFFQEIKRLKVLHFTGMCLLALPSSFHSLVNLRTLYFEDCALEDTALLGQLERLEILSFRGSKIKHLSRDIGQLNRLKLLSLRDCVYLKTIPANVISRLSMLEELYVINSFRSWEINGECNASLAELKLLSNLRTLAIDVPDA